VGEIERERLRVAGISTIALLLSVAGGIEDDMDT
jgi:hypothetical protein